MTARRSNGLLDTSVVIDLERIPHDALPVEASISAVTLAELSAGPHAAADNPERGRRQELLQAVEATFAALPFDDAAARAYGRIYGAIASAGRKARGRRLADLLIAATAVAHDMPLYTRNSDDFRGLESLLEIVAV